jgi:hypothetical protein
MSRRIAHRPRYQSIRSIPQTPPRSHKDFLRYHWTYRSQNIPYQKRHLGQGIMLIPWGYRLLYGAFRL